MRISQIVGGLAVCVAMFTTAGFGAEPKSGKQGRTEGTFVGIEHGDYAHLLVKTAAGKQESYFVLQVDKSVQPYVDKPGKMRGRKIRVLWREKMENLPEAGGPTKVQVVERIEPLK
jgi:hypothetical protein